MIQVKTYRTKIFDNESVMSFSAKQDPSTRDDGRNHQIVDKIDFLKNKPEFNGILKLNLMPRCNCCLKVGKTYCFMPPGPPIVSIPPKVFSKSLFINKGTLTCKNPVRIIRPASKNLVGKSNSSGTEKRTGLDILA